jgi:hypothetical protein
MWDRLVAEEKVLLETDSHLQTPLSTTSTLGKSVKRKANGAPKITPAGLVHLYRVI